VSVKSPRWAPLLLGWATAPDPPISRWWGRELVRLLLHRDAAAATLARSYEGIVRGEMRFRVGRLVYAAFCRDDTIMGFA